MSRRRSATAPPTTPPATAAAATVGIAKVADFVGHKLKKKFDGTADLESNGDVAPQASTEETTNAGDSHSADLESTR